MSTKERFFAVWVGAAMGIGLSDQRFSRPVNIVLWGVSIFVAYFLNKAIRRIWPGWGWE